MSLKDIFNKDNSSFFDMIFENEAIRDKEIVPFLADNSAQKKKIRKILEIANSTEGGKYLLNKAKQNGYTVYLAKLGSKTAGKCRSSDKEVILNDAFDETRLVHVAIHEFAHAEQNMNSELLGINAYNYPSKVVVYRAKEADACAKSTLEAWYAKENGNIEVWDSLKKNNLSNIAQAVEFNMTKYKDSPEKDLIALSAGFKAWYRNTNYREYYDNSNLIERTQEFFDKGTFLTTGADIDVNFIAKKICAYKGKSYFSGDVSMLYDPLYSAISPDTNNKLCKIIDAMPVSNKDKQQSGAYDLQVYSYSDPLCEMQMKAERIRENKLEQAKIKAQSSKQR